LWWVLGGRCLRVRVPGEDVDLEPELFGLLHEAAAF